MTNRSKLLLFAGAIVVVAINVIGNAYCALRTKLDYRP